MSRGRAFLALSALLPHPETIPQVAASGCARQYSGRVPTCPVHTAGRALEARWAHAAHAELPVRAARLLRNVSHFVAIPALCVRYVLAAGLAFDAPAI